MQLFVFTRRQDRLLCVMDNYVFSARIGMSSQLIGLYFKSSQIYLFDRILATSCSVQKQIHVLK